MTIISKSEWRLLNYNFDSLTKLVSAADLEKARSLLPSADYSHQRISFILKKSNSAVANALRRTVISELPVRRLNVELKDIQTDDKEIKLVDLQDRISLIPIAQDTPIGSVFTINITNREVCTSADIVPKLSKGVANSAGKLPFSATHRVVLIQPGKFLRVEMSVIEGRCMNSLNGIGATFSLTAQFEYQSRDYITISFLSHKKDINTAHVAVSELLEADKVAPGLRSYITEGLSKMAVFRPSVLVVPGRAKDVAKDYPEYKYVISESDAPSPQSITVAKPSEFYQSFIFNGNIAANSAMMLACSEIISRLNALLEPNAVSVTEIPGGIISIIIRHEDHTLGRLLETAIFELDPNIGLVNYSIDHFQIRLIRLNLIHPQPMKIFKDAINALISDFTNLRDEFEKIKLLDK